MIQYSKTKVIIDNLTRTTRVVFAGGRGTCPGHWISRSPILELNLAFMIMSEMCDAFDPLTEEKVPNIE